MISEHAHQGILHSMQSEWRSTVRFKTDKVQAVPVAAT